MPIYYLQVNGGIPGQMDFKIPQFTQGRGNVLGSGAFNTEQFFTPVYLPNAQSASAASCSIILQHSVVSMNITVQPVLYRYRQNTGTMSTSSFLTQTMAATNTFTGVDPSWSGSACGDQLALDITYTNTAMTSQNYSLSLAPLSYVSSSIPINTGSCPVNRNRTFTF